MPLPASVVARATFPDPTELIVRFLRQEFPDIDVQSKIELFQQVPFVLVCTARNPSGWGADHRFVDHVQLEVQVFTDGPDADYDGGQISDAIRVALFDVWRSGRTIAGLGRISDFRMTSRPHEVPDWATATGPVQYADLPSGFNRTETRYTIEIRRALT